MNRPSHFLALAGLTVAALWVATPAANAELRFEAEDYSTPKSAWLKNGFTEDKWNLWSTDKDADKKWSGGVVLRTPLVMDDREKPEDGAPALHTHLTGIPKGTYDIAIKVARVLGVSLDGKTWHRYSGGLLAAGVAIEHGTFDLWVDDRYAMEDPKARGAGYYDYVILHPAAPVIDGVANPGFEIVDGESIVGWSWWSRTGKGQAAPVTDEKHGGKRSAHLTHDGERDWAFTCRARRRVKVGEQLAVVGWVKSAANNGVQLSVVGAYNGKRVTWRLGSAGAWGKHDWQEIKGYFTVPDDINDIYVRFTGSGKTDVYVDDIALRQEKPTFPTRPPVEGWATQRAEEPMGRGVVALPTPKGVYVGWRLLRSDPPNVTFDVYRSADGQAAVKLNETPLAQTADFLDTSPPEGDALVYDVRGARGAEEVPSGSAQATPLSDGSPFLSIKLKNETTRFQKAGLADLNGDGAYDFVIKHPHGNVDPYRKYWYRSPETYKIEAYLSDGTYLWTNDLGWAIERGIWYSPFIAYDLDGDGKAEVAAKVGEGDPRDEEGKVASGPEWLAVWDGMTGKEIARVPWPGREDFPGYNYASRNQIAVAYLDGKTPCLLALRGTYNRMKVDAYQLRDGKLDRLWEYDNGGLDGRYWGQGAHFTSAVDVDDDGRDEIVLGSAVLDDNGVPLWSTGKGHPDFAYVGDIDPRRKGLEICYGMETRQRRGGLTLADAATGKLLWQLDEPTGHVHGKGMCADIDPGVSGLECYGCNAGEGKKPERRWLYSAAGEILGEPEAYGFGISTAYWDADLQKEIFRGGRISDYGGGRHEARVSGSVRLVADLIGDWREELITSVPGELRVYSTSILATDRRVCLMQDRIYRLDTAMNAMGYTQGPMLSYSPEALSPGLNLTAITGDEEKPSVVVVVSAPLATGIDGKVSLSAEGVRLTPGSFGVGLKPGEKLEKVVTLSTPEGEDFRGLVTAQLELPDATLCGQVSVRVSGVLKTGPLVQAENFSEETGGKVRIRDDKAGAVGKAFSHWDAKGHALTWRIKVAAGRYRLVLRYCCPNAARRSLTIDGRLLGTQTFPETGGFGNAPQDWEHLTVLQNGQPALLDLQAGEHLIRLENIDDVGLNLDYLALLPAEKPMPRAEKPVIRKP